MARITAAPRAVIRRSSCRWPLSALPATAQRTVSQPNIYTLPRSRWTSSIAAMRSVEAYGSGRLGLQGGRPATRGRA